MAKCTKPKKWEWEREALKMYGCVGWLVKWNSLWGYTTLSSYNFIEWMISMTATVCLWHHCNIVRIRPNLYIDNIEKTFNLFLESKDLLRLAKDNKESHFFLDEVHISQSRVSSKVIAEISNIISMDNFLWIACQSDRLPTKTDANLKGKVIFIYLIFCWIYSCFSLKDVYETLWRGK